MNFESVHSFLFNEISMKSFELLTEKKSMNIGSKIIFCAVIRFEFSKNSHSPVNKFVFSVTPSKSKSVMNYGCLLMKSGDLMHDLRCSV